MIKPTVGRVVLYYPHIAGPHFPDNPDAVMIGHGPFTAHVCAVWTDTCVNLAVFDANGVLHSRCSVLLHQEGEPYPDSGFCEWMPYQKGQAAKTEALEARLAGNDTNKKEDQ